MDKKNRSYDIITMGRSSIDLYAGQIGAQFKDITSFNAYIGGSPTNIAVGTSRLGLISLLLTAVGEDPVGDFILNFLENEGIETRYIPYKSGTRSSAVILGIQPPDHFPLLFYRENAADIQLNIDDVLETPIADSKVLLISGTGLNKDPGKSATIFACEQAGLSETQVILDLDFRADQWHDPRAFGVAVRSLLPLVNVTIGTEEEVLAANLSRSEEVKMKYFQVSDPKIEGNLEAAINMILSKGVQVLVVKRGKLGASVYKNDNSCIDVPGFPVEVLNILGAGDAFASGLIFGIINEWDWYKSVRWGNACGAIMVTRHGCANSMATKSEVLTFIEENGGI